MSMDGRFYKKEINEGINEFDNRVKRIKSYLQNKFKISQFDSIMEECINEVANSPFYKDDNLTTGVYDEAFKNLYQDFGEKDSSLNQSEIINSTLPISDVEYIRREEIKENIFQKNQNESSIQSQNNQSQQTELTPEQIQEFEERKKQYAQKLEEQIAKARELEERMNARRGGR